MFDADDADSKGEDGEGAVVLGMKLAVCGSAREARLEKENTDLAMLR